MLEWLMTSLQVLIIKLIMFAVGFVLCNTLFFLPFVGWYFMLVIGTVFLCASAQYIQMYYFFHPIVCCTAGMIYCWIFHRDNHMQKESTNRSRMKLFIKDFFCWSIFNGLHNSKMKHQQKQDKNKQQTKKKTGFWNTQKEESHEQEYESFFEYRDRKQAQQTSKQQRYEQNQQADFLKQQQETILKTAQELERQKQQIQEQWQKLQRQQSEFYMQQKQTEKMTIKKAREILGVTEDATPLEIKRVYRQLVKLYHADVSRNGVSEEMIKRLNESYYLLVKN